MPENLIASAKVTISAPMARVWDALVNPAVIKRYMFGATVVSDWTPGSPIAWKGEWKGKPFEDKGRILEVRPEQLLKYSHFSPLSGAADRPENYHNVTIALAPQADDVRVELTQDHNDSERARAESEKNWAAMLEGLKKTVES